MYVVFERFSTFGFCYNHFVLKLPYSGKVLHGASFPFALFEDGLATAKIRTAKV